MTFDIPNKDGLWVFNAPSLPAGTNWKTWVKPTQYNNFIIYACGGGGAGGAGQSGAAGTIRTGGGGGAGGILQIINTPSYLLPETLYISIGRGGTGGASNGLFTYICYYPNTNTANVIIQANGGFGGTAGASGGAGGSVSFPYVSQSIFSYAGTISSGGTNGGAGAAGANFSITTSCIYGGAGGGGVDASNIGYGGGNILASNIHPQLDGGAVGVIGNNGYFIKQPFTALGGTGGGSNPSGTAFSGGNGVWGSGGGGGGAGIGGNSGGNGGDGFVIIIGY